MNEFDFDNEDIEWTCENCEDKFDRNGYVTKVTIVTGEVIKAEDGYRVIDMEPQFPPQVEHLCYNCYSKKYKEPGEALRVALGTVANVIELLEAEANDDFYNPKEALDRLNKLVVYLADYVPPLVEVERASQRPKKAAAVGVLWVDDEGAEIVEELSVGDIREQGRWTQTLKEIVIRKKVETDG